MAKAYVNKRDKFLWDNSFKPEDKIPVPSSADEGKAIVVDDDGNYALDDVATDTIYFDLRVDTSDYSITVTDTEYTVAEINTLARTYTTPILLRVQYDENNIYRLFRLYRVEAGVTKWNDTVSVAEDDLVTINNDLINLQNDGTVRIYRRSIDNTNMHNYSTTEQVIGTWIDGKPLYEKTVEFTTGVANTYLTYDTGIQNPNICMINFTSSFFIYTDTSRMNASAYEGGQNIDDFSFRIYPTIVDNKIELHYRVGTKAASKSATVTIQYTKTTD